MSETSGTEDVILPETMDLPYEDVNPQESSKKPRFIFVIITILAFVGLIISLIVVITDSNRKIADLSSSSTCESKSPYYDPEDFNSSISFARERLRAGDYDSTEFALKQYSQIEHMTATQKYRYYSVLADMYSQTALNNPTLSERYSALADENLTKIREGEE